MDEHIKELARREARKTDKQIIGAWPKEKPMTPVCLDPPKRGWQKSISCRRCGANISEAHWNYCPNCGQAIKAASYAGVRGWDHETAEQSWAEDKQ